VTGPAEPVAIRLPDGGRADRRLSAGAHVELYVASVHRGTAGLVEIVGARRDRSGRLVGFRRHESDGFITAGDRQAARARALALDSAGMEVFLTPATLAVPEPGDRGVGELSVAWVDIDESGGVERLRRFNRRPHLVCRSGGGGAHAYWRLSFPVSPEEAERANRMLASVLGADLASTNRGRLMRCPGTRHRKSSERWCQVVAADLARAPYDLPELVAGLSDPKPSRAERRRPRAQDQLDDVPPPAYFERIAGRAVPAEGGFVCCPATWHADHHPSCFVYPEPGRGFYCFACGAGGGAADLASAVAGGPTGSELRGDAYRAARARALAALGRTKGGADEV